MRFEKVSFRAFYADVNDRYRHIDSVALYEAWEKIVLPVKSTQYSAGYDIRIPIDVSIPPDTSVVIPTGVKAVFSDDEMDTWHLQMYVRSSVGIKQGVVLTNGTGIIDPDYQFAVNEGDMMLALTNTGANLVKFKAGERVCQAVFAIHGKTSNDFAYGRRTGGIGSTGR